MADARHHAAKDLVLGVAEQFARAGVRSVGAFLLLFLCAGSGVGARGAVGARVGVGGGVVGVYFIHLLGVADAVDDLFHMVDGDGEDTLRLQLAHEFGHTVLHVVGNLFAPFAAAIIATHVLVIFLEQFVCVFIDVIKRTEYVDGDVLFHCFSFLLLFFVDGVVVVCLAAAGAAF